MHEHLHNLLEGCSPSGFSFAALDNVASDCAFGAPVSAQHESKIGSASLVAVIRPMLSGITPVIVAVLYLP